MTSGSQLLTKPEKPAAQLDDDADYVPEILARRDWLVWVLPATLTLAVCGYQATTAALWTDELATWSAAKRSIGDLFDLLGNVDAALGAYYIFMHYWIAIFGDSTLALRAPSLLAMAGSAALLAVLGRRLYGPKAGLTAGVLFALVPSVTRFGQEARVYALVLVLAIAATQLLLVSLERSDWKWWAGYGLVIAFLGMAHTLALLLLAAHAIEVGRRGWAIRQPRGARRLATVWLAAVGGGLVLASPIIWWGFSQRDQVAWNAKPRLLALTELPGDVFGTPIVGGFVLGIALWAVLSRRGGWAAPLLVSWALVGPFVLFVAGRFTPVWNPRYVLFAMPAVLLLAVAALRELGWRELGIAGLAMALIVAPQQKELRKPDAHAQMDGRAIAALIKPKLRSDDAFAYVDAEVWAARDTIRYYLDPRLDSPTRNGFALNTPEQAAELYADDCETQAECRAVLNGANRVWLVRWGTYPEPLWGVDKPKVPVLRDDYTVTKVWELSNMTVVLFDKKK